MPYQPERIHSSSVWYQNVERAKEKAKRLLNKLVAVNQTTSIAIGKLVAVDIDRLWQSQYPYCKMELKRPVRFRIDAMFQHKMGDVEIFFANKPEMIMSMEELAQKFSKIYENLQPYIKKNEVG